MVYEEVYGGVKVLSAVAQVNKAVPLSSEELLSALNNENAHLAAVEAANVSAYQQDFLTALQNKQQVNYVGERPSMFYKNSQFELGLLILSQYQWL